MPSGGFYKYLTRSKLGSQRTARASAATIIRGSQVQLASAVRKLKNTLQIVDRQPAPALLPILRSQQRGEILALLLGDPDLELSLTETAARTGAPHPSVYREIQRAEQAGLVTSRKIGNTRLVRANTASPYYSGLAEILTRAFGVPAVLAEAVRDVNGITAAYIYGSWAAPARGTTRPAASRGHRRAYPRRTRPGPALCRPQHRRGAPSQAGAGHHPRPRLAGVRIWRLPRHGHKPPLLRLSLPND